MGTLCILYIIDLVPKYTRLQCWCPSFGLGSHVLSFHFKVVFIIKLPFLTFHCEWLSRHVSSMNKARLTSVGYENPILLVDLKLLCNRLNPFLISNAVMAWLHCISFSRFQNLHHCKSPFGDISQRCNPRCVRLSKVTWRSKLNDKLSRSLKPVV